MLDHDPGRWDSFKEVLVDDCRAAAELEVQLCRVASEALIDELGAFRVEVWDHEKTARAGAAAANNWRDPVDAVAWHWLVRDRGVLVAAARLSLHTDGSDLPDAHLFGDELGALHGSRSAPLASMNRLVVATTHRNRGVARRLTAERILAAMAARATVVVVSASTMAPHLAARGFRTLAQRPGKHFPGMTWSMMVRDLAPDGPGRGFE
ncbi:MAG: GNAT family N-acyltransferase [Polyangiales bacterium]